LTDELPCGPPDLNHPKVKPLTRAIAHRLGLDERFIAFLFAGSRPACFRYRVEDPGGGWTCNIPLECEAGYPLWSRNGDQTLLCAAPQRIYFVQGYHDDPQVTVVARTSQGLLADLFIDSWEGEESDEALEEAARVCGFRFLGRVLGFCAGDRSGDYDEERRRLVASVDSEAGDAIA
jgi:hypothetical protein